MSTNDEYVHRNEHGEDIDEDAMTTLTLMKKMMMKTMMQTMEYHDAYGEEEIAMRMMRRKKIMMMIIRYKICHKYT